MRVGLLVLAGAVGLLVAPPARGGTDYAVAAGQEESVRALLSPTGGALEADWRLGGVRVARDHIVARYESRRGAPAFVTRLAHPSRATATDTLTERFAVGFPEPAPDPNVRSSLFAQIRAREGGFNWKSVRATPAAGGLSGQPGGASWVTAARVVALALLALFGLGLPFLMRALRDAGRLLGAREARLVLAATGLGLVVRLLAPHRFVKVFMGYPTVHDALRFESLPKYGTSVPALHHLALNTFGVSYDTILFLHSVLGALSVGLAALWLGRLRAPRGSATVAAFALALLPLLVKEHNSESYLVPALFWLFAGLVAWQSALDSGRRGEWLLGAVALGLACTARPLLHVFAPALALVTLHNARATAHAPGAPSTRWFRGTVLLVVLAGLLPNALHVWQRAGEQASAGALPGLDPSFLGPALWGLLTNNVAFLPSYVPTALPLLAFGGLLVLRGAARRGAAAMLAVALLWWLASFIDLPPISRARLQSPGVLLMTLAAAAGAAALFWRVVDTGRRRAAWVLATALALSAALGALASIGTLWSRGNADEEADFFAEAIRALPPEPVVFVRLGEGDEPRWGVHRAYPDRFPLAVARADVLLDISEWLAAEDLTAPVYVYLGVRCHAASREGAGGVLQERPLAPGRQHPLCERARQRGLTPVLERHLPNHPTADFPWYPEDEEHLLVGLYRWR